MNVSSISDIDLNLCVELCRARLRFFFICTLLSSQPFCFNDYDSVVILVFDL